MITFEFVPAQLITEEIKPNANRHLSEMNIVDEWGEPDVDWDSYNQAGLASQCFVLAARDDGKLVGYSIFSVGTNPRYKNIGEADSHGLFIEKEYRGKLGQKMIDEANRILFSYGIKRINYTNNDPAFGKLLAKNSFKPRNTIWSIENGQ